MKNLKRSVIFVIILLLIGITKIYSQKNEPFMLDMSTEEKIEKNLPMLLGSSNQGTEFWLTFHPNNTDTGGPAAYRLYITSDVATKVTLQIPGRLFERTIHTKSDDVVSFELSPSEAQCYIKDSYNHDPWPQQVFPESAIHLYADDPFVVYGMSRCHLTSDGFLGIPISGYGDDYIVPAWNDYTTDATQYTSYVSIVGVYDKTKVNFTLGGSENNYTPPPNSIKTGDEVTKTLNAGDVWIIGPKGDYNDVSGSIVSADKPVSVLSGNYRTSVMKENGFSNSRDYLIEHILPIHTWGKKYHVSPIAERKKASFIRIFSSKPNTLIYRDGDLWAQIPSVGGKKNEGWIMRRAIDANDENPIGAATISANKPISVYQFNPSQEDDGTNIDPFMMLVSPIGQYLKKVVFCTPGDPQNGNWAFDKNYMNLIYKSTKDGQIPSHIEYGQPINGTINWMPLNIIASSPGMEFHDDEVTDGRYWRAMQMSLPDNAATYAIRSDEPFMAYGYGFENSDSYGYPLSASTRDLSIPDVWSPTVAIDKKCNGNVIGVATEQPKIDSLRSNFVVFELIDKESYNYELKWNEDDFVKGVTDKIEFELALLDKTKDGKAVISMGDRAGNDTTFIIEHNATRFKISPSINDWEVIAYNDPSASKTIRIINDTYQAVEIDSVFLLSTDATRNHQFSGFSIDPSIYSENGGILPRHKMNENDEFDITVTFDPESVADRISEGQTTFIDSIGVKAHYSDDEGKYCFYKYLAIVKASAGSPIISVDRLDFEETTVGTMNIPTKQQVIYNVGEAPLTINEMKFSDGFDDVYTSELFTTLPAVIPAGEYVIIAVSFNPKSDNEHSETIEFISDSDTNRDEHDSILEINGSGFEIETPTLISPQNKSENISTTPTFTWNKSSEMEQYRFELSFNNIFDNPLINKNVNDVSYSVVDGLNYGENYYWRVNAEKDGVTKTSEVWRFKTEDDVSVKDELESTLTILPNPANDYISITSEYTIQSIKVFSQTGEMMIETLNAKIDISDLTVGVYFILVESELGIEKGEFIKK
jgi:hypothetical protein